MVNVPTLDGQKVAAQPLAGGFSKVADYGAAPYLDAAGQAAAEFGDVAARNARILQAQQDQIAVFNASADARADADQRMAAFDAMDGPAALEAGPKLVAEFRTWAAERGANLSERQRETFRQHAEDIALGMTSDVTRRSFAVTRRMADDALGRLVQTETASARAMARSGQASPAALTERWNAIASGIKHYTVAHSDSLPVASEQFEADATAKAKSDYIAGIVEGYLESGDDQAAAAFFASFGGEIKGDDHTKLRADVERAAHVGTVQRNVAEIVETALEAEGDATLAERESLAMADARATGDKDVVTAVEARFTDERRLQGQRQVDAHAALDTEWQAGRMTIEQAQKDPRWGQLTAEAQRAMLKEDEQRRKGLSEPAEPDPAWYLAALNDAANPATRGKFAALDLLELRPLMTKAQYDELDGLQKELRKGGETPKADAIQTAVGIANNAATIATASIADSGKKAEAHAYFEQRMLDDLRNRRDDMLTAGKPWDEETEAAAIKDRMLAKVVYDVQDWGADKHTKVGFLQPEEIDVADIPADVRGKIDQRLGAGAADDLVQDAYLYWLTFGELP